MLLVLLTPVCRRVTRMLMPPALFMHLQFSVLRVTCLCASMALVRITSRVRILNLWVASVTGELLIAIL